ncbi:MAG: SpoIIE family protein phosphatase [Streptosporangiaceae bacterium]|nr:SpoIIE family protein phosphatase [Streptosporangiaceae bacterium]
MTAWGSWDEAAFDAYLPANMVLSMADIAVIVADRLGNLLYMNEYAARLFRVPAEASELAGQPLSSLGLVADGDLRQVEELSALVLRGRSWEGTFESKRPDGTHALLRALAVPLRHPAGDIDGMVILAREVSQRAGRSEEDRLALLERIGERLSGSLEIGATLRHVAEMLVPQFADHCFIDLYQGDALVRRVQRHASDWTPPPGTWAQVGEQIYYPEGHFCQQAMARLDPVIVTDLEDEHYPAPSEESMAAADEAGLTSVIAAPLYARGVVLGVMSLALSRLTDRSERNYDTPDRDLIGAIASRVAIAIDNAMLFETERQTALAFQKSLLPQAIPELDGLEVACRYVPAKPLETQGQGIQTQVGGDWYDIIPLAAGRVGIVIGDVEGRGARAAAIMGQLRAALRAFAQDEKAPADIMRKLDEWCRTLAPPGAGRAGSDPPTASCIYMIYDAWSRELTFANAGHDGPILVSDGEARQLEFRYKGVLLGVRGRGIRGLPTYKEETIIVPPGAVLVFYTDGLTDRRTRADGSGHYSEEEATEMLRHAVRAAAASGDPDVVATAAEYAVPGDIDDDMAILVAKSSPSELASTEQVFPAEPIMVSEARRLAAQTFRSWGMATEQTELACLLVSEVVTNAVLHASITPSPGRRFDLDLESIPLPVPVGTGPLPVISASPPPHTGGLPDPPGHSGVSWDGDPTARGGQADGGTPAKEFAVRLRRGVSSVWVEVFDPDLRLPRIRTAGETDEGGRGLYLVEQLATRWGSRPTPEGKAVWFEMPLSLFRGVKTNPPDPPACDASRR